MTAQIIDLSVTRAKRPDEETGTLPFSQLFERCRGEMMSSMDGMIACCNEALAVGHNAVIAESVENLSALRERLDGLRLGTPEAVRVYGEVAGIVEKIGSLISDEIRGHVLGLAASGRLAVAGD